MSHCCGPKSVLDLLRDKNPQDQDFKNALIEHREEFIRELRRVSSLLVEGDDAGVFGSMRLDNSTFTEIARKILYAAKILRAEGEKPFSPLHCQNCQKNLADGLFYGTLCSSYANRIEKIKAANNGILPKRNRDEVKSPFKMMSKSRQP